MLTIDTVTISFEIYRASRSINKFKCHITQTHIVGRCKTKPASYTLTRTTVAVRTSFYNIMTCAGPIRKK